MLWHAPRGTMWNPWVEMTRLQREMDHLFNRVGREVGGSGGEFPAVNIWTGPENALLTAEMPGINPAQLEIAVKNDTVTIRGQRELPALKEEETPVRQERGQGAFVRAFSLPFRVDADKVQAHVQKGVLQIVLPRSEADKPKKISVTAA